MDAVDDFLSKVENTRAKSQSARDPRKQAALGQYFTPGAAAELIASMPTLPESGVFRVLDPGAGSGALVAALVARIVREHRKLDVEVVAVEMDPDVAEDLRTTMTDLESFAAASGLPLRTEVQVADFIESAEDYAQEFDMVIMNPPYAKLAVGSRHRSQMSARGLDSPNLYSAFMELGLAALRVNGQFVSITPRSFANGVYFEPFRARFLSQISIDRLHVFESRNTVFADTGVLQENVILAGTRSGRGETVTLSVSVGHRDAVVIRTVPSVDVVKPSDPHVVIHIPSSAEDAAATASIAALPDTLQSLGVSVSTGKVVDFRSRENIVADPIGVTWPMVYPANLQGGMLRHPSGPKGQYFRAVESKDVKLLVPAGHYVIVKRFSSKEEKRRVVAGVWDGDNPVGAEGVAFDNKLNYLHAGGAGLDRDLAIGLSLWLNSTIVDTYFRTFSGHTQVNASDLRGMRFPSAESLCRLGAGRTLVTPSQLEVDRLVEEFTSAGAVAA